MPASSAANDAMLGCAFVLLYALYFPNKLCKPWLQIAKFAFGGKQVKSKLLNFGYFSVGFSKKHFLGVPRRESVELLISMLCINDMQVLFVSSYQFSGSSQ